MGSLTMYARSPSPSQPPAPNTIASRSPFPLGLCSCSTSLSKMGTWAAPRGCGALEEMRAYPRHVLMWQRYLWRGIFVFSFLDDVPYCHRNVLFLLRISWLHRQILRSNLCIKTLVFVLSLGRHLNSWILPMYGNQYHRGHWRIVLQR